MNFAAPLWAFAAAVGVVFTLVGGSMPKQPSDTPRTPTELCEEVAHELNQQYVEEMITREQAQRIIDRCYRVFVK